MNILGCGTTVGLTYVLFWLQQLPVDTQAIQSMASLRATSLTSTMWSSSFATLDTCLRELLGPSAWPTGSGATCCPPAEVSHPSSPTPLPSTSAICVPVTHEQKPWVQSWHSFDSGKTWDREGS